MPLFITESLGMQHAFHKDAYYIPLRLASTGSGNAKQGIMFRPEPKANLSPAARQYLAALVIKDPDADAKTAGLIWMHALAVGYSPAYLSENADGIRRDWPRIPLPANREALEASAELGRRVAALLDTETEVPGVTAADIEPVFRTIGVLSKVGGGSLDPGAGELAVRAGWGYSGKGGATMPGTGQVIQRPYTPAEKDAIAAAAKGRGLSVKQALDLLGADTAGVYLNERAFWKNIPANVWNYHIGGYQVIKKWLSYREEGVLGRALTADEAREVTNTARRLAALLLMQAALDGNYVRVKAESYEWEGGHT